LATSSFSTEAAERGAAVYLVWALIPEYVLPAADAVRLAIAEGETNGHG
jgi:hypothetical protein